MPAFMNDLCSALTSGVGEEFAYARGAHSSRIALGMPDASRFHATQGQDDGVHSSCRHMADRSRERGAM
jgi:hypothetical protein